MKINDKRGISTVVETVLIIMITVAAVGIIAYSVIPMITNKLSTGTLCLDAVSQIQLVADQGYPCKNNDNVSLQIRRGSKDFDLAGVQVLVSIGGNSHSYDITDASSIPGANEERVLFVTNANIKVASGVLANATSVKIAPIVNVGKGRQICDVSSTEALKQC